MIPQPTFDDIFAVLAAASVGNTTARVALPTEPQSDDLATRFAIAVNLLLDDLNFRTVQLEASHQATQAELERLVLERTAQLRKSEEKFAKAFRASPAAISIATLPDGRWIEVNEALEKMTGYPRAELLGRTSIELGLVDPVARATILDAMRTPGFVRNVEIQMLTKTKAVVDVLMSVEHIELDGQTCALTIQYDITGLKHAHREIQRLNADLEARQLALEATNAELEAFSYSVSHDLRTPLRAINGFSQALMEDYHDLLDEDGQEYLELIRMESQRMARLIDDLIDLSRYARATTHFTTINLSALAQQIAKDIRQEGPQRQVEFIIEAGLEAYGDLNLIEIVLRNLLENAFKYTRHEAQARIEFGATQRAGVTTYYVRDNGVGFNMNYVHKLFGPFQRLHGMTEFEGTGIGLATVQRIINRHGGTVSAEGTVNEGATFYFTLGNRLNGEEGTL